LDYERTPCHGGETPGRVEKFRRREMKNLLKGNSDFILGIIIIIFSGVVYWLSTGITSAESAMLPKVLAVFMGLMGLGISVRSLVCKARTRENDVTVSWADIVNGILIPGAFLLAAYGLIGFLGFYAAEFLLVAALLFLQNQVTNGRVNLAPKRLLLVLLYSTGVIAAMYLIFHFLFKLPTPVGIFGF